MAVDGHDDGGSHLQLQLVHQEVKMDVAHRHGHRGGSKAEGVSVTPPVVSILVFHEPDDQVEEDGTGEAGAVGHEFQDPDDQEFRQELLRQCSQQIRPLLGRLLSSGTLSSASQMPEMRKDRPKLLPDFRRRAFCWKVEDVVGGSDLSAAAFDDERVDPVEEELRQPGNFLLGHTLVKKVKNVEFPKLGLLE